MVLELNEYIRTKGGIIAKVIGVQSGGIEKYYFDKEVIDNFKELTQIGTENVVLKHSFNIIDLIEVGDYVNGYLVKSVSDNGVYIDIPFVDSESIGCGIDLFRSNEIESIVTKEQFERMEYEVK